jgi:hypothetical protein
MIKLLQGRASRGRGPTRNVRGDLPSSTLPLPWAGVVGDGRKDADLSGVEGRQVHGEKVGRPGLILFGLLSHSLFRIGRWFWSPCCGFVPSGYLKYGTFMAIQVRIALATAIATAIAKVNLHRAESGETSITMKASAVQVGVAAPAITRLARTDGKVASALSLDLASRIVTDLDCGIEGLSEVVAG